MTSNNSTLRAVKRLCPSLPPAFADPEPIIRGMTKAHALLQGLCSNYIYCNHTLKRIKYVPLEEVIPIEKPNVPASPTSTVTTPLLEELLHEGTEQEACRIAALLHIPKHLDAASAFAYVRNLYMDGLPFSFRALKTCDLNELRKQMKNLSNRKRKRMIEEGLNSPNTKKQKRTIKNPYLSIVNSILLIQKLMAVDKAKQDMDIQDFVKKLPCSKSKTKLTLTFLMRDVYNDVKKQGHNLTQFSASCRTPAKLTPEEERSWCSLSFVKKKRLLQICCPETNCEFKRLGKNCRKERCVKYCQLIDRMDEKEVTRKLLNDVVSRGKLAKPQQLIIEGAPGRGVVSALRKIVQQTSKHTSKN